MRGWLGPLDEVADPVFAGRMLGDGLAVDPLEGALHAPCDGVVVSVHAARHAVTLRAEGGAEILLHVGLETVALGGAGFEAQVAVGQAVRAGDRLVAFDLDAVAGGAASLISPILVVNGERFEIVSRAAEGLVEVGDFLMELREASVRWVVCGLPQGVHARPAARIVGALKPLVAEVHVLRGDRRADARGVLGLLGLEAAAGQRLGVSASGPDAAAALAAVCALLEGGVAETSGTPVASSPTVSAFGPPTFSGVTAAPGLAIGRVVRWTPEALHAPLAKGDPDVERGRLEAALAAARADLAAEAARETSPARDLLTAHAALLDDPALAADAEAALAKGVGASQAWRRGVAGQAAILAGLADARLAARAADLADVERRVLRALSGRAALSALTLAAGSIVVADDLLPSDFLDLDRAHLAGLCLAGGGPTAHVAILAASAGLPMLVAAGPEVLALAEGVRVILDADAGGLIVDPAPEALAAAQVAMTRRTAARAVAEAAAGDLCRLADGMRVEIGASLGAATEAVDAVAMGAEACGLLRTELMFLDRDTPPDEDEQLALYQAIADALDGRPLTIRTLDVGGDKTAPYLPLPLELNPALGLRGVRVSLRRPDLLATQLRAILRLRRQGLVRILIPMVTEVSELRTVRDLLDAAAADLGVTGAIQMGAMIETPAAAVTTDLLAVEADFLSIGSNDLTQYALAMDRGDPLLAARLDALHPAVLRMIGHSADGAARAGRPFGVCGALAADPLAAPILVGLGARSLSVPPAAIAGLKARLRQITLANCVDLARRALAQPSAADVRSLAAAFASGAAR